MALATVPGLRLLIMSTGLLDFARSTRLLGVCVGQGIVK